MRAAFFVCIALSLSSGALHEADAGIRDWHKPLAGIPITDCKALSPRFQRRYYGKRTESHILAVTQSNTLAAINPNNGSIAWRHAYEAADPIVHLKTSEHVVMSLSGPGGANLRAFESRTGNLLWEKSLHDIAFGLLSEPVDVGTDITFVQNSNDIIVLSNLAAVDRVSSADGSSLWRWSPADATSLNFHSRLVQSTSNVFVIALSKSFSGYTIYITVLDIETGQEITAYHVPSNVKNGLEDMVVIERILNPQIIWLEKGVLKFHSLITQKSGSFNEKGFNKILDVGLSTSHGLLVALKADETAMVFEAGSGEELRKIWEFADSARSNDRSPSLYSGGFDKEGKPYISRVFYAFPMQAAGLSLYAPDGRNGTGLFTGIAFPFDTNTHGVINHVALDVANLGDDKLLSRVMLSTSTGAVQLWQSYDLQWTREESLSEIEALEFVDLPDQDLTGSRLALRIEASIKAILSIQHSLTELVQDFRRQLSTSLATFISGKRTARRSSGIPKATTNFVEPPAPQSLYRDDFGFHKIIVAVTSTGKVYGIHSGNGAILWSRLVGVSSGSGVRVTSPKLHVLRSVMDGATLPVVSIVANKQDGSGSVLLQLNALTGDVYSTESQQLTKPSARDVFLLRHVNRSILAVDDDLRVAGYKLPDNATSVYFNRVSGTPVKNQLTGYLIITGNEYASKAWSLVLGASEIIQSTLKVPSNSVASLGKVLANRGTLYKYLNGHLIVALTTSSASARQAVYLLDGTTGSMLYHTSVTTSSPLMAAMSENWLVYTYLAGDADERVDSSRAQHIVSVELYEGSGPNDITRSSEISSFSDNIHRLTPYQNSFILPFSVKALAMTSTKYGISSKDLIVATERNQIQSVPRRLLDPRRHKIKPSAADTEEMLIPYNPLIMDDHRRVLSHNYDVVGVKHIVTSPALLESTSLVLAYGQDLFFTRVSPSGTFDILSESFNKVQLVLIIIGLTAAIVVTRPIVHGRQLKQQWYY